MDVFELLKKNRSYRRFDESVALTHQDVREMVICARYTGSAANRQPLKFIISTDAEKNAGIFPTLRWAAYLKDWDGPAEGERPTAYVVVTGDTTITENWYWDPGMAAQAILLSATEKGFGGCMIAALDKDVLRAHLAVPQHLEILMVIALGKPAEKILIEEYPPGGDIRYWRDRKGVHHVPKRPLDELILEI